jgi:hypothetical protein
MPAQTIIKLRRGTASQWSTANPVLSAGEIGLETNTNRTKYGDGTTAWNALPYSVADASGTSSVDWSAVLNKPSTFTPSSHTHAISEVTNLQTALDAKAPINNPTLTGTVVLPSTTSIGNVSATEIAFVDGVTSSIQTQINGKANTSHTHSMQQVHDMPHPFLLMGA